MKPLYLRSGNSHFNSLKMAGLTQDGKYMLVNFEDKLSKENPILSDMVDWEPPSEAPAEVQKCCVVLHDYILHCIT